MNAEYYDKFYKSQGPAVHADPLRFTKIAELCRGRVLDMGCGTGDLADFYKGPYVGIDFSKVAIEMAKEIERPNADFWLADIEKGIDTKGRKFDSVVLAEVLEHVENEEAVITEAIGAAMPKGRLIISVPNGLAVPDKSHVRIYTIPELRKKFEQYGRVKFYNWPGASRRIIMTVDLGEASIRNLALVMIVKNEEKGLEHAILSAVEICDQIVISVDSASSDKTEEIARNYADIIKKHEWRNDFAAARNFAQEGVQTNWILSLDGHEYVKNTGNIEEALKSDVEGLICRVQMENGFTFPSVRIYRPSVVWTRPVHNLNECKTQKEFRDFLIVHDRQNNQSAESIKERTEQRNRMIPEILGAALRKNPKDSRAAFYLANFYFGCRNFKLARKYYKKYLRYSKFRGERWLACYHVAISYQLQGKHIRALWWARLAEKEEPERWETAKLEGLIYMGLKWYSKAAERLVQSFDINKKRNAYEPIAKNDAETWEMLSSCFCGLRQFKKAIISLNEALKKDISEEYRKKLKNKLDIISKLQETGL